MNSKILCHLVLGLGALACAPQPQVSTSKMINGAAVPAGQFGSTVVYLLPDTQNHGDAERRCSAVKVSSRFILTAAHCLVEDDGVLVQTLTRPNAKLEISNFGERDATNTSLWHSGYIKNIRTSVDYENAVMDCAANGGTDCRNHWDIPAELALVEFTADLPAQWPQAQIDLRPVSNGERLALVGYGHQEGRFSVESRVKKKFSYEVIQDWSEQIPVMAEADAATRISSISPITFTSFGAVHPKADIGSTAGLMPGDSGGPVYRGSAVVGIHRSVYFDANQLPLFHVHSRLNTDEVFLRRWLPAGSFVAQ